MQTNAIAVANKFVEYALQDEVNIRLSRLINLVFIAHGFSLALYDRPLMDHHFDVIEAWDFGVVIPSVLHAFNRYKNNPITGKASLITSWNTQSNSIEYEEPSIGNDEEARKAIYIVWNRYKNFSDHDLADIIMLKGSPWNSYYVPHQRQRIPDDFIQAFYKAFINQILYSL